MPWARIEGALETHPKLLIADLTAGTAIALWVKAIAHCAQHATDGYVDTAWCHQQLHHLRSARQRREVLARAVSQGLLDALPARSTRTVKVKDYEVTIGPHEFDGFVVHDYTDFNPSSPEVAEQRRQAAKRQADARERRQQQALPWDGKPGVPA